MTLAQVNGCDRGRACWHWWIALGVLQMPTSVSSLGEGTFHSPKNAEMVEKEIKHRSGPQEHILFEPPSAASNCAGSYQRRHFDAQM